MKYYIIEVQRTYNTEVIVKCKDEKTVQRILDATPDRRDDWDAQTHTAFTVFTVHLSLSKGQPQTAS